MALIGQECLGSLAMMLRIGAVDPFCGDREVTIRGSFDPAFFF
jgi:hypothetical protein